MQDFKMDLYKDEIYVFTPTGELIKLAKGATVLDFAFAIHTKLGCKCVSAKVNEKNVPIKYTLNNGDTVSIVTAPTQTPKRDWLNIVVTSKARVKIKQALREETAKAVDFAKEMLQRRFKNRKIEMEEPILMRYIKKKGFKTVTDFLRRDCRRTPRPEPSDRRIPGTAPPGNGNERPHRSPQRRRIHHDNRSRRNLDQQGCPGD